MSSNGLSYHSLLYGGTSAVGKYLAASGLSHAGCSLGKASSSGGTLGVLQMGLEQLDRRDFLQNSLTNINFNSS